MDNETKKPTPDLLIEWLAKHMCTYAFNNPRFVWEDMAQDVFTQLSSMPFELPIWDDIKQAICGGDQPGVNEREQIERVLGVIASLLAPSIIAKDFELQRRLVRITELEKQLAKATQTKTATEAQSARDYENTVALLKRKGVFLFSRDGVFDSVVELFKKIETLTRKKSDVDCDSKAELVEAEPSQQDVAYTISVLESLKARIAFLPDDPDQDWHFAPFEIKAIEAEIDETIRKLRTQSSNDEWETSEGPTLELGSATQDELRKAMLEVLIPEDESEAHVEPQWIDIDEHAYVAAHIDLEDCPRCESTPRPKLHPMISQDGSAFEAERCTVCNCQWWFQVPKFPEPGMVRPKAPSKMKYNRADLEAKNDDELFDLHQAEIGFFDMNGIMVERQNMIETLASIKASV